jgi:hypothetical protein
MESADDLYQPGVLEIAKRALDEWAKPSEIGQAYHRFLHGVRRQHSGAEQALPLDWQRPYTHLLTEIHDSVNRPLSYHSLLSESVVDRIDWAGLSDTLYGPAGEANLRENHRYGLEWTYRDSANLAGSDFASKTTGRLQVVNVVSPTSLDVQGFAHAGIGFLVQPGHAITRLKMAPTLTYRFHHLIYHDSPETLAVAITRGFVRLVAFQVNPFTKTSQQVAQHEVKLWESQNQPIVSRHEDQRSGSFNGAPVELSFLGTSNFLYAVCCVATVWVSRIVYGGLHGVPPEPTLCTGNLECNVSAMWLNQEKLA